MMSLKKTVGKTDGNWIKRVSCLFSLFFVTRQCLYLNYCQFSYDATYCVYAYEKK